MSWFARIEETCAAFIERAFANMFPSDLEPAQIARKLVATMEARTQISEAEMTAPSRYRAYVHPADYERLAAHRAYLQQEWSALLADVAGRVGIRFADGPPAVELCERAHTAAGAVDIVVQGAQSSTDVCAVTLRVTKGMPANGTFRITGAARVGRNAESEIFLVDPSVSRHHALLDVRDGVLIVRDVGSTNGTFVNGQRVQQQTLHVGDAVAFGKSEMVVESQST